MKRFISSFLLLGLAVGAFGADKNAPAAGQKTAAPQGAAVAPIAPAGQTAAVAQEKSAAGQTAAPAPQKAAPKAAQTDPLKAFTEWDKKLTTLNTAFEQTTSYDGVVISRSHGKLFFQAQGQLLRLDTLNDEEKTEQTAVTDKKVLRILDASGKEITAMPWAEWVNGQPNKALFDFGHYTALLQAHQATVFNSTPQRTVLKLLPKDKSAGYTLYLLLDGKDYFPQSIIIESDLMKTQADLKQTVKNKPLAKNLFKEVIKK
ncbi:outer-membrane lipoprotein carrier protein LolA [Candidatus Avelusimicrobium faecicola]|uniref:LolA family protein n=1 Tax=Candidatus Avelusimicrobium faecicola TaxID=3416205 RepID=UPI003D0D1729